LLLDTSQGDSTCFSCGNVVYLNPPAPEDAIVKRDRRPSHAGNRLS
jgi:hypothetical protein